MFIYLLMLLAQPDRISFQWGWWLGIPSYNAMTVCSAEAIGNAQAVHYPNQVPPSGKHFYFSDIAGPIIRS